MSSHEVQLRGAATELPAGSGLRFKGTPPASGTLVAYYSAMDMKHMLYLDGEPLGEVSDWDIIRSGGQIVMDWDAWRAAKLTGPKP